MLKVKSFIEDKVVHKATQRHQANKQENNCFHDVCAFFNSIKGLFLSILKRIQ